jgi:hypothetical protein
MEKGARPPIRMLVAVSVAVAILVTITASFIWAKSSTPSRKSDALASSATVAGVFDQKAKLAIRPAQAAIFTAGTYVVQRPITLRDARPVHTSGLEVVEARATTVQGSHPGYTCTREWPPKGFRMTEPIDGLVVNQNALLAVTFYVRRTEPGDGTLKGLIITYEDDDGEVLEQQFDDTSLLLIVREKRSDFGRAGPCFGYRFPDGKTL